MSIPDFFFKKENTNAPYAQAVAVLLVVGLVVWALFTYIENKRIADLKEAQKNANPIARQQQIDLQNKNNPPVSDLSPADQQRISEALKQQAAKDATISAAAKQKDFLQTVPPYMRR